MASFIEHVPPHDYEAEQAVLGAAMVSNEVIPLVARRIGPASFYRKGNGHIFQAILALHERGEPVDLITIRDEMGSKLDQAGGYSYLVDLAGSIPTAAFAEHYAKIVADKALLRNLMTFGGRVITTVACGDFDGQASYEAVMSDLLAIQSGHVSQMEPIKEIGNAFLNDMAHRMETGEALTGCLTFGLYDLDAMVTPAASDLLILAGRPAMGKTSKALNWARHVAQFAQVDIYSLEMSKEQLYMRLIQDITGIPVKRQRGVVSEDEYRRIVDAHALIADLNLDIDDNAMVTVEDIRAEAQRKAALGNKPALILVDYLQLMGGGKSKGKDANREQELAAISRGLKQTARDVGCVVAALSQLSRKCEERTDKRPMLSDLRESGAIEQDADIVMFIYRDDYYHPETSKKPGMAEVIVAKYRNGPVGTVDLKFEKERTRFSCPEYGGLQDASGF